MKAKKKRRVCRDALPSCWAAIINLLVCSNCCDLSVICRGLRLFLCPLLLSALIEILLCRMFPHPRSKSHLARPESSEISEMLWRTITCLKNAVDVLLAAKWLGSFLSSLNSMAAETLDVVKMLLFLEDDDVPQQQEPVGQARCISQHQSTDGIHQLKDLKVGLGAIPFERGTLFGKFAKALCKQTRLLYSVIKRPGLNRTCPGHQGHWEQSSNII